MTRHEVTVCGKRTVFWERNSHGHETVVLLHGFRGNHKGLTDFSQHLDGFRLILPDLPGYGESEPLSGEHTIHNYAQWLDEFVGALGLDEWVSWSHSYSGLIALIQAAEGKHKPSRVVSVSLAMLKRGPKTAMSTFYYQSGKLMPPVWRKRWVASRIVDRGTGRWLFQSVTTKRRIELMDRGSRNLSSLDPKVVTEEYLSGLRTDATYYARRMTVPTLVIAGAKDVIVPVKRLRQLVGVMPDGMLVVMEDQGHLAPIERPAATAAITKRFIEGLQLPGNF